MKAQLLAIVRKPGVVPAVSGVLSFGAGAVAGYFLARHKYSTLEERVEEMEQLTLQFEETTEAVTEALNKVADNYRVRKSPTYVINAEDRKNISYHKVEEGGEGVVNVFTEVDPNWNYEIELQQREHMSVYVIHRDEFFGDEMGWDNQSTLTWYEEDQVLVDERDVIIPNPTNIVGEILFGHGSGDPNVVYVRNETMQSEYEVLRDPGSFQISVLGYQVEYAAEEEDIRHSKATTRFYKE